MRVRLGYVAIALNLPKVTSSSTVTYSRYQKINNEEERLHKLKQVTYSNLKDLETILNYNIKNNIHFYRITSNLIPLATHPDVMWDYRKFFKDDFRYIGNIIKENNMRVDAHPDQFNVINSDKDNVVQNTIKSLNMQVDIFEDFGYKDGKLVVHIGGGKGGKEESINRFMKNLEILPKRIRERLILENDDKTFTAREVLKICQKTKLPMVLDVHHYNCNNSGGSLNEILKDIFNTWKDEKLPPKVHFSSPKEFENDRKHSDYIDANAFIEFLDLVKEVVDEDFDVMIEAKQKDLTLIKLMNDLKEKRDDIKFIDKSTIEI